MSRFEHDRPSDWLRRLSETPSGYRDLVAETGGLAQAAYRLARAQCRAEGRRAEAMTLRELQTAALVLGRSLGAREALPIRSLLTTEDEHLGASTARPTPPPPPARRSSFTSLKRAS